KAANSPPADLCSHQRKVNWLELGVRRTTTRSGSSVSTGATNKRQVRLMAAPDIATESDRIIVGRSSAFTRVNLKSLGRAISQPAIGLRTCAASLGSQRPGLRAQFDGPSDYTSMSRSVSAQVVDGPTTHEREPLCVRLYHELAGPSVPKPDV